MALSIGRDELRTIASSPFLSARVVLHTRVLSLHTDGWVDDDDDDDQDNDLDKKDDEEGEAEEEEEFSSPCQRLAQWLESLSSLSALQHPNSLVRLSSLAVDGHT